jgi:hypothetical protein
MTKIQNKTYADNNEYIPFMMPHEYDVKMERFTCSRNSNVMGYRKKLLKVKLRGKAEDAFQGLGHHGGPVILIMTCAAKLTEIPAREN